ncbi:MAG: hypothetical protein JJU45_14900 [Acidimicrobiia bacterium]|nr:hypothetical protein [Acidimicrobiia bacterium]
MSDSSDPGGDDHFSADQDAEEEHDADTDGLSDNSDEIEDQVAACPFPPMTVIGVLVSLATDEESTDDEPSCARAEISFRMPVIEEDGSNGTMVSPKYVLRAEGAFLLAGALWDIGDRALAEAAKGRALSEGQLEEMIEARQAAQSYVTEPNPFEVAAMWN